MSIDNTEHASLALHVKSFHRRQSKYKSVFVFYCLLIIIIARSAVWLTFFFLSLIVVNRKTMQYMMRNALEWNSSIFSLLLFMYALFVCTVNWNCTLYIVNTQMIFQLLKIQSSNRKFWMRSKSSITRLIWFLLCNVPSHILLFKNDSHSRIPCDWCFYLYCHKGTESDEECEHWTVNNNSTTNIRENSWMDAMDRCVLFMHLPCDLLLMFFRTLHWMMRFLYNFSISCNKFSWLQNRKQRSNGNTTL